MHRSIRHNIFSFREILLARACSTTVHITVPVFYLEYGQETLVVERSPVRLFWLKSRSVSSVRLPIFSGIVPARRIANVEREEKSTHTDGVIDKAREDASEMTSQGNPRSVAPSTHSIFTG